ncbi:3-hydroxyisobutyryl-CoA hydrolase, partial [Arthrobacter methylotrophus]
MAEVLFEKRGHLGVVTLNRPQAVNALTSGMVHAMLEQLTAWADDDAVKTVLVRGAGDRGLCAGGDIVAIYDDMLRHGDQTADFWAAEYRLNSLISRYPKPYVAFMDGLVLGGGVGISAHGSVRVVTERTRTGMPETTIGFVPDVGGTLLLSRSPGESGTHAALTGAHLSGADALFLGLADHFVPSESLPALAEALESST